MMEEEDSYGFEQTLVSYIVSSKWLYSHWEQHEHKPDKLKDIHVGQRMAERDDVQRTVLRKILC